MSALECTMPININFRENVFEFREFSATWLWLGKNTFWHFTLASEVHIRKYVEVVQRSKETQESALSHFRPKVKIWHSNTQTTHIIYVSKGEE
jgi:hypothetical protein